MNLCCKKMCLNTHCGLCNICTQWGRLQERQQEEEISGMGGIALLRLATKVLP